MKLFILAFILSTNIYAYVDMSNSSSRARDLNMKTSDYVFAMAISGTFSGALFGLFLWKIK